MLFLPFRVQLQEVDKAPSGSFTVYYGIDPKPVQGVTASFTLKPETMSFFEGHQPLPIVKRYLRVEDERIPVLFESSGDFSFDPVAGVFYFLSGWQEVHTKKCDEHGRFPFECSIQSALNLAAQPTVDWMRLIVATKLKSKGAILERKTWGADSWMCCPTHDIDYDRKWRPGIYKREVLDRSILNQNKESIPHRIGRTMRAVASLITTDDPFRNAMNRMRSEVEARNGSATYFLKSGGRGLRDVSYDLKNSFMLEQRILLQRAGFGIGLHPSYHTFLSSVQLEQEKTKLDNVMMRRTTVHLSHYLRYQHPKSAYLIAQAGFKIDSSLGFATQCGFRHATCLPFPLFNPVEDVELDVWEMPLSVMESALFNRMNLSPSEAIDYTRKLIHTCADFGGVFVGLWHNTLWDELDYPGWGAHFEATLDETVRQEGGMKALEGALDSWK